MFNIVELLDLFGDEKVKKIILSSYLLSQKQNSHLSDLVFQHLFFLKLCYPNLSIEIDYKKDGTSNYNPQTNTIYLNGMFDETTFLHELTHMFSYHYSQFIIPQEFYYFRNYFLSVQENEELVISFLQLCDEAKENILNRTSSIETDVNIDKELDDIDTRNGSESFIICQIEDIIDSLYSGKLHTQGLTHIKDNNSLPQKSSKGAGHGCTYFDETGLEFEEILADYQAIKMIAPNNRLFILLKQILGDSFVSFLDDRCRLINGENIIEIEFDNNINK